MLRSAIWLILLTLLSLALPLHVSPNPLLPQPWPLIETYHYTASQNAPPGTDQGESIPHRHPIAA